MTNSKKGVAKYATNKPTLGKTDTANQSVAEAAKEKHAPGTTEQPLERGGSTVPTEKQKTDDTPVEQTPAFAMGREAKRHGIDKLDAPFADGDDKVAWLKGYDFEPDQI